MNRLPANEPGESRDWPEDPGASAESQLPEVDPVEGAAPPDSLLLPFEPLPPESLFMPPVQEQIQPPDAQPPLFQSWYAPQVRPTVRIPHFGHLCLLILLSLFGILVAGVLLRTALHFRLFGISTVQGAVTEIHYTLGSEAALYLFTFAACLLVFPLFWHKNFFSGLQWNGATAFHLRKRLLSAAFVCFLFALLNGVLMPGPSNTPIERIFRSPGAAWMLFAFGITLAPFFEEMFFRGFLLPALCTAYDWFAEKTTGAPMRPLGENGHPQWSVSAMVTASVATSIPFAWMHAAQTGYALGPFFLLMGVSLVLCTVRLWTRSLAASVLVHASYNFMLFSLMLLGTDGFRHLNKM